MFQFTAVKITRAAAGGHIIRPRTNDVLELHVGRNDDLSSTIDEGVYNVTHILCDIFNDTMHFFTDDRNIIMILDGKEGTDAIMKNLVILSDES